MKRRFDTIKKAVKGLDLPADTFTGGARIEVVGNSEVNIDGCKGILDYNENSIKISTGRGSISITGTDLLISSFLDENMIVTGTLSSINFNA